MELEEFECTFSLVAKMAVADGTVSTREAKIVEKLISEVLKLDSSQREKAISIFNQAKKSNQSFAFYAEQYKKLMTKQPEMLSWILDVLVKVSYADKLFSENETKMLQEAATIFGLPLTKYEKFFNIQNIDPHLAKLGCGAEHSIEEITKKFESLSAEYSPDKIQKLDLPKEFVELAKKKCEEFSESYLIIKKVRGS